GHADRSALGIANPLQHDDADIVLPRITCGSNHRCAGMVSSQDGPELTPSQVQWTSRLNVANAGGRTGGQPGIVLAGILEGRVHTQLKRELSLEIRVPLAPGYAIADSLDRDRLR